MIVTPKQENYILPDYAKYYVFHEIFSRMQIPSRNDCSRDNKTESLRGQTVVSGVKRVMHCVDWTEQGTRGALQIGIFMRNFLDDSYLMRRIVVGDFLMRAREDRLLLRDGNVTGC